MKSRVIVAAVITKGESILLGKKKPDIGPYKNTWVIPGGGVDLANESLVDALKREIQEECLITIQHIKRFSFSEDFEKDKHGIMTHYVHLVYTAEYVSGELRPGDDIVHLEWIPKKKLKEIPLPRVSKQLFKDLGWL